MYRYSGWRGEAQGRKDRRKNGNLQQRRRELSVWLLRRRGGGVLLQQLLQKGRSAFGCQLSAKEQRQRKDAKAQRTQRESWVVSRWLLVKSSVAQIYDFGVDICPDICPNLGNDKALDHG